MKPIPPKNSHTQRHYNLSWTAVGLAPPIHLAIEASGDPAFAEMTAGGVDSYGVRFLVEEIATSVLPYGMLFSSQ